MRAFAAVGASNKSMPQMLISAGGRREIAGQHLHGGGFAGAIGTEKAQNFAALDFEVHAGDRGVGAEFSGKPLGGNSNLGGGWSHEGSLSGDLAMGCGL